MQSIIVSSATPSNSSLTPTPPPRQPNVHNVWRRGSTGYPTGRDPSLPLSTWAGLGGVGCPAANIASLITHHVPPPPSHCRPHIPHPRYPHIRHMPMHARVSFRLPCRLRRHPRHHPRPHRPHLLSRPTPLTPTSTTPSTPPPPPPDITPSHSHPPHHSSVPDPFELPHPGTRVPSGATFTPFSHRICLGRIRPQ